MMDNDSHTGLVHGAKAATDDEKKMSLLQGIRLYPKAIAFSILISTCIAMEGYDLCLLGNFCELMFGAYLPQTNF
jgi:MFS transporter, SP family, general alpha glucoside:H+ symporter